MVSCNRIHDHRILAVFLRHIDAELDVGAFVFVCESLADIVEQSAAFGLLDVQLQLCSHHPGEVSNLLGMTKDVLAI